MAKPVLNVTYDRATYAPGDPIVVTVDYSDPDTKSTPEVWTAVNENGEQATITVDRKVVDAVTITAPAGYVKQSDDGARQVWRGTA